MIGVKNTRFNSRKFRTDDTEGGMGLSDYRLSEPDSHERTRYERTATADERCF